ncbi:hypothetical protein DFH09DRAFT_1154783 [Mycena vulgaris]|nr:hypothetical protein DFH09DRAFT_1154783 [Mycena vulgaris]
MPVTFEVSPFETVRSEDASHLDTPPPYDDNPLLPSHSLRAEPKRPTIRVGIRPLPRPPARSPAPSSAAPRPRPVPRRRASGGCFVDLPLQAKRPPQAFFVCNPSESPTSPAHPSFPSPSPRSGHGRSFFPINIIPATPLPPPTPGFRGAHSRAYLAPPTLDSPSETVPQIRTVKMHRRLGGSVGSVPASVLEELRSLGEERHRPRRSMTLPHLHTAKDSDSSSSDEEYQDAELDGEDEEGEEAEYSWVMGNATRAVRPKSRISLKWVQDLGGDRWIADRYSSILRAL